MEVRRCNKCGAEIIVNGTRVDIIAPRYYICKECNEYLVNLQLR